VRLSRKVKTPLDLTCLCASTLCLLCLTIFGQHFLCSVVFAFFLILFFVFAAISHTIFLLHKQAARRVAPRFAPREKHLIPSLVMLHIITREPFLSRCPSPAPPQHPPVMRSSSSSTQFFIGSTRSVIKAKVSL
jgi:hypothetical protein